MITLDGLARTPNALAPHYSLFRVAERLLLTGHSHQAWPDVARDAQLQAFDDAADLVDDKWERAFAQADEVRAGFRRLLADPAGEIALGVSTHDLVIRFLSSLDLTGRRRQIVTSTGEFHTLRRQLARLAEAGIGVTWVDAEPADTLAERMADAVDDGTAAVLVSAVLFETARIVPHHHALAVACQKHGAELLVDAYHALGVVPVALRDLGLTDTWIVGGGYKYLQLGEGNCFLRLPGHAEGMRPVVTGWFAEFDTLDDEPHPDRVAYGPGAQRFAGATYDPTSHYRAARVFRFFADHALTPPLLRQSYLHQLDVLAAAFDALDAPDDVVTRDRATPLSSFAGFLALRTPHARELRDNLKKRGVNADSRGEHLRFGPAPYLADAQLEATIAALGDAIGELGR